MSTAAALHDRIAALAPITGIALGRRHDRTTWRIDFAKAATSQQRAAAQAVLAAFDPQAVPAEAVKAQARRRILARYPDWRQANMTARGVELAFKAAQGLALSPAEAAEAAALQAAWSWIKAIRATADALEGLSSIPADFAHDRHWPA
jgi:hypothetical protein